MTLCKNGLWVLSGLLLVSGCKPAPQVTQYTVPKPATIALPRPDGSAQPATTAASGARPAGRPERMLGAIWPVGEQVWFFKLNGPVEPLADFESQFQEFVKGIRWNSKAEPQWTLPAGWSERPGNQFRFATVVVPLAGQSLELTVSALPLQAGDRSGQILSNVNRWRGQLGLSNLTPNQLEETVTKVPRTDADGPAGDLVFTNFAGTAQASGMTPPFAGSNRSLGMPASSAAGSAGDAPAPSGISGTSASRPATEPAVAPGPNSSPKIVADVPPDWKAGATSTLRQAAWEFRQADQRIEVTVIALDRSAGDRPANVNRWRGQVGLEPLSAEQVTAALTPVEIGTLRGDLIEIVGDPQAKRPQAIYGVIVDREQQTWFIKLQGDPELAAAQRTAFLALVRSLKFEPQS